MSTNIMQPINKLTQNYKTILNMDHNMTDTQQITVSTPDYKKLFLIMISASIVSGLILNYLIKSKTN